MLLSRVLQGLSSGVIWTVGLAFIAENVNPANTGRQIGWAVGGIGIGTTLGPVLGGVLYDRLGWEAPFVFCIGLCVVDYVGRLLVLEKSEVAAWTTAPEKLARAENAIVNTAQGENTGATDTDNDNAEDSRVLSHRPSLTRIDTSVSHDTRFDTILSATTVVARTPLSSSTMTLAGTPSTPSAEDKLKSLSCPDLTSPTKDKEESNLDLERAVASPETAIGVDGAQKEAKELTILQVIATLLKSRRAVVAFIVVGMNAMVIGSMEPA